MEQYNTSAKKLNNKTGLNSSSTGGIKGGLVGWVKERAITLILFGVLRAVASYAEKVADMNADDYEKILASAREYNQRLAEQGIQWVISDEQREEYIRQLDISGTGVMGYIKIPKIDVMLPVYHGTDEAVLQISIGHLEQSSLPVGGETSHCMMSGHRGLPSARLFTDLDKLKEGDTFTMTILNETLTYEVDHIWIVEPSDLSHLVLEDGKDYCTLITCTPYGINSHRLLVRAHRIENVNGDAMVVADAIQIRPVYIAPFLAIPILILLLIYVLISTGMKKRNARNLKDDYLKENGLTEAEIEIEDKELIMDAARRFMNRRTKSAERGGRDA